MRMPAFRKHMVERVPHDEWMYPNMNSACVIKFDEKGNVLDCLWDLTGRNHPMITSMREHKGYLYLGGSLNNRHGQIPADTRNATWAIRILLGCRGMMGALKRAYESFRGGGDYSITVPPMDGALRPNNAIEEAELVASAPAADNVVADANRVVFSSGQDLLAFEAGRKPRCLASYDGRISALALFEDALAVGLSTGRIAIVKVGSTMAKSLRPSPADSVSIARLRSTFAGGDYAASSPTGRRPMVRMTGRRI